MLKYSSVAEFPIITKAGVALAIGFRNNKNNSDILISLLEDKESFVRARAIEAIGQLKVADAVLQLEKLLGNAYTPYANNKTTIRDLAIRALKTIATPEAVMILDKAGYR